MTKQQKPTFGLVFKNYLHYQYALEYVAKRHPQQFNFDSLLLTIYFFSDSNRKEMKECYDIFGWSNEIKNL